MSYGVVSVHTTVMLVVASTLAVSTPVDGNVKVGELTTEQDAVTVSEIGSAPDAVPARAAVPTAAMAAAAPSPIRTLRMIPFPPVNPRVPGALRAPRHAGQRPRAV